MSKLNNYDYIYLHGFASSPNSSKAQFYKTKLQQNGVNVNTPDLNGKDFTNLTLTNALNQVQQIINQCTKPIVLIGSSMGGLISCLLAETNPQITKLILLAPAFKMSKLWQDGISNEQLTEWVNTGYQPTYHYGYEKQVKLHYEFYTDMFKHNDSNFTRNLPCLIFHGTKDKIVPINLSEEYSQNHPMAKLISLDDDHSINKNLNKLWNLSEEFLLTLQSQATM